MKLKEKLLNFCIEHSDEVFSGEILADHFQVTRAAVWKAMKAIKEDGYQIETALGKGYCFRSSSEPLNSGLINAAAGLTIPLILLDSIDSTNNYAKKMIIDGCEDGTFIIADSQTSGRGRKGHSFYSPTGTGLYVSYILKRDMDLSEVYKIGITAAAASAEAIRTCSKDQARIKWPNDLFVDQTKVGGILVESTPDLETMTTDAVVIGIGINCRTVNFPEELSGKAGSLTQLTASRNQLAGVLYRTLQHYLSLPYADVLSKYRADSAILQKEVVYIHQGETKKGFAADITEDGKLLLQTGDETAAYSTREIRIQY